MPIPIPNLNGIALSFAEAPPMIWVVVIVLGIALVPTFLILFRYRNARPSTIILASFFVPAAYVVISVFVYLFFVVYSNMRSF